MNSERLKLDDTFTFGCSDPLPCFGQCCRSNPNIWLTPYDIMRLKNSLRITSHKFLERYSTAVYPEAVGYPVVWLKLSASKTCPFSVDEGCSVYSDRPWVCRMFPLVHLSGDIRATPVVNPADPLFYLNKVAYCRGFEAGSMVSVRRWRESQGIGIYEEVNSEWKRVTHHKDFASRNFIKGPDADLFYLCCYNIDDFRKKASEEDICNLLDMDQEDARNIETDDTELLKLSLKWLRSALFNERP